MATGSGDCDFERVSDGVLELVLARLPVTDLLAAARVCKHWCAVTRARGFAEFYDAWPERRPWFFQLCVSYLCPANNECHGYDPETRRWHLVSGACLPPPGEGTALAGSPGADSICSVVGLTHLSYKRRSFLAAAWERAPAPSSSRVNPLVGLVEARGEGAGGGDKLVVAGGVSFFEDDHLAVETYDTAGAGAGAGAGAWEACPSMPAEFLGNGSRHWMTAAVAGGRFYVAEIHSGATAVLDVERRVWSGGVRVLRPPGALHSHLLAWGGRLVLAAWCCVDGAHAFRLWLVKEATLECGREIARMPAEMCALFESGEDVPARKGEGLRCAAAGGLVYVFFPLNSREQSRENQVAVCDLSLQGSGAWSLLPPLPERASFNHAAGFSSPVTLKCLMGQA